MAYNVTVKPIRINMSCSRHRAYTPVKGEGAIRGGCPYCLCLFTVHRAVAYLHKELKKAEELFEKPVFTTLTVGRKKRTVKHPHKRT